MKTIDASWISDPCFADCFWFADSGGDLSRKMHLEIARQGDLCECRVHVVDQGGRLALVEGRRRRDEEQLSRSPVGGGAEEVGRKCSRNRLQLGDHVGERRSILGRESGGRGDRHDRHIAVVHRSDEWLGERRRLVARRAGREERTIVVVDLARQRRQRAHGDDGADDPEGNDQPAQADDAAPQRIEEATHRRSNVGNSSVGVTRAGTAIGQASLPRVPRGLKSAATTLHLGARAQRGPGASGQLSTCGGIMAP